MGAIGGEELMKWEKMQGQNGNEEKILVLVRLRPLNDKEIAKNEVSDWECINETTILYRNSLQERSGLPTIYSFDRVYRGDCSTREVYEEGARGIALSVVTGINSTIFAYGQTSSGKTYTMNGITEYTVDDIYDYIQRHEERAFVLKFSAMEIYNEVLRDLLSTDNSSLRILDDPERGTIVEKLTEETLRDKNHLKELLSICEAQRQVGETSLNETSSRSHQILRLTIESSAREFLGKDNSTALASSVNFVDLAGSERASQASSVGQRLKEGCHINRSLLTLGTVIRKLSKGRQGHINYRDSKLTRILQPSLGGNARTAIICTLSPARTHVEQSRNTLLFASCAKEVSTNAHVNVVMSDKALVKQLQKELARLESELRNPGHPGDYPALLRKKDMQIEKLEREVKELTKQRDLAQSRIEDLLQTVRDDQVSNQWDGLDLNLKSNEEQLSEDTGSLDESSPPPRQPSGTHIDDICKEVRCIETDESPKTPKAATSLHQQNGLTNSDVGQQVNVFQNTVNSPLSPYPNEPSSPFRSFTRSLSCRANLMTDLNDYSTEKRAETTTPPNDLEREYPGRPEERIRRKHWGVPPLIFGANSYKLSRNNSQSSNGSSFIDELKSQNSVNGDEEILSVDTFVAGLKEMAKLHQVEETESKDGKSVKDIGVGTMPYDSLPEASSNWPLEFEKMRKLIIELWHTCNVSLIHRTYFFILFKGDPTDSIYMEVELRRLLYLKEAFSKGGPVVQNGQKLTLESSLKTLKREREMLSRLMYKRFTEDERNKLYKKWAINLNSKQRKLQLINLLWSYTVDINHVTESASIVAKLIRFSQHGPALKETFGISFTPPRARRSFGWKN